jgi:hypothetical protein
VKEETVQKLAAALIQARTDLFDLIRAMNIPEEEALSRYDAIIRENGEGAKMLRSVASLLIPFSDMAEAKTSKEIFNTFDAQEFATFLRSQPDPSPEQVNFLLGLMKDALPNLKSMLLPKINKMPRYKHGGRRKLLKDENQRHEIREEIKKLRNSSVKLEDLFKRLGERYGVSPTTIKRIWLEKPR